MALQYHETPSLTPCTFPFPKQLSLEQLKAFLFSMILIRRFEERAGQIYTIGKVGGFCHLYIGQEAIAVGALGAMGPVDTAITAYRSHGHMLACGASARSVMAELMGKQGGCAKGKGGSMHMFSPENRFYGGHGIVGAQISLGTGLGFAHAYRQDGGVCLTFLGDGAANQGQFFESMNMAALWDLPVLYIIENNGYAMGTSVERACAGSGLYTRGQPFGIEGLQCDGDDVLTVHTTISQALERIRHEKRPLLIEFLTYRFRGHSMSDPGRYRPKEEVEDAKSTRDPIERLSTHLIEKYGLSQEEVRSIEDDAKEAVKDALQFSEASPLPPVEELLTDVLISA